DGGGDVVWQYERYVADAYLEDDRVVVAHFLALPVGGRRIEHRDRRGALRDGVAGALLHPRDAGAIRGIPQDAQRLVTRDGDAVPDRGGTERPQDGAGAADVIGIAIRD